MEYAFYQILKEKLAKLDQQIRDLEVEYREAEEQLKEVCPHTKMVPEFDSYRSWLRCTECGKDWPTSPDGEAE